MAKNLPPGWPGAAASPPNPPWLGEASDFKRLRAQGAIGKMEEMAMEKMEKPHGKTHPKTMDFFYGFLKWRRDSKTAVV